VEARKEDPSADTDRDPGGKYGTKTIYFKTIKLKHGKPKHRVTRTNRLTRI